MQEKETARLKLIEKGVSNLKGAYEGMLDMENYIMELMKSIEVQVVAGQEKNTLFGVVLEGTTTKAISQTEKDLEEEVKKVTAQGYNLQNVQ